MLHKSSLWSRAWFLRSGNYWDAFPFWATASPTSASVSDIAYSCSAQEEITKKIACSLNIRFAAKCRRSETGKEGTSWLRTPMLRSARRKPPFFYTWPIHSSFANWVSLSEQRPTKKVTCENDAEACSDAFPVEPKPKASKLFCTFYALHLTLTFPIHCTGIQRLILYSRKLVSLFCQLWRNFNLKISVYV